MTLNCKPTHSWLSRLTLAIAFLPAAAVVSGCATPPTVMDPFAGIREAQTRAQVEKQASNDPFPSPSDVGLQ